MRLLGFTFVFAFLGLIGHVVSYQQEKLFACSYHRDCAVTLGPNCFCLKQPHQLHGECLCKLGPSKNACSFDGECSSKAWPGEMCYCAKEANQSIGKCKCDQVQPLLG